MSLNDINDSQKILVAGFGYYISANIFIYSSYEMGYLKIVY